MRGAVVLQQVAWESPAALVEGFQRAGASAGIRALHRGDSVPSELAPHEALVILSGPWGPEDLATESSPQVSQQLALARTVLAREGAVLGIGFGAALLAHAAGQVFCDGPAKDRGAAAQPGVAGIGWGPITFATARDPVLDGIPERAFAFHWYAEGVPAPGGATALASSAMEGHHAFRLGPRQFGFSFHIETDAVGVAERLRHAEPLLVDEEGERVWAETKQHIYDHRKVCDRLLDNVIRALLPR
jgi:GMP synthase-like glutamine amidotransferase